MVKLSDYKDEINWYPERHVEFVKYFFKCMFKSKCEREDPEECRISYRKRPLRR